MFLTLRAIESQAKARKEEFRDALKEYCIKNGTADEKGSRHFEFPDGKATATFRKASSPNVEKVRKLLDKHGIDPVGVLKEKVSASIVADASVLEEKVRNGAISQDELEACYDTDFSFNVAPSKDAKKVLVDI